MPSDVVVTTATEPHVPWLVDTIDQARTLIASQRGGPMWLRREGRASGAAVRLADLRADAGAEVLVGEWAGVPFGYALAHAEDLGGGDSVLVVDELYVEPDGRGIGVGEALLGALVSRARQRGCAGIDALALPGQRDTKNLFERCGLVARAIIVHLSFEDGQK